MIELRESIPGDIPAFIEMEKDADTCGFILPYSLKRHQSEFAKPVFVYLSMVNKVTMHLLRAIPNAGKYLGFSIEGADNYPWQEGLFVKSPYDIVDGKATIPDAPGWGVEINPEWLDKASYQISEEA